MFVLTSRVLLLTAIGLACWGVYLMLLAPASVEADLPLVVDWPVRDLGQLSIGSHEVTIHVTNPAGRTRRVIGMMSGCRPNVCFGAKLAEPVAVPPGETVEYVCEVTITGSGPFEFPILLHLEDNGIRTVEQTLRGVAIAPGGKANAGNPKSGP